MLLSRKRLVVLCLMAGLCLVSGFLALASTVDGIAGLVLGRSDFTTDAECDSRGLSTPASFTPDTVSTRVYVADTNNHRVLWWNTLSALVNNDDADGVIGQADLQSCDVNGGIADATAAADNVFNNPTFVAVDASGNVWVADYNNHRVLRFSRPTANGASANLVLGQADFLGRARNRTGSTTAATANTLYNPHTVVLDGSGHIWVSDRSNQRLLHYTTPSANGADADLVLGQADFTHNSINRGGTVAANTLYRPHGITLDSSGNIWVADRYNQRVLRYSTPSVNGADADLVLGQADFTHNSINRGTTVAANSLYYPEGVSLDASGNVWVADSENNRMVRYSAPSVSGGDADLVLGQADFTSRLFNRGGIVAANTLYAPTSSYPAGDGSLWVVDKFNHRVLKYTAPVTSGADAVLVLGSSTFADGAANSIYPWSLTNPYGIAVDRAIGRLYVADAERNRVLWWNNVTSLVSGKDADGVIGQTDLYSGLYNLSGLVASTAANALFYPRGVAVDSSGNVWVVDQSNHRVLKFNRPSTNGESAVLVLGQADFTHNSMNRGGSVAANSLNYPRGIAVDSSGNIWVADRSNHRVLRYSAPSVNGADADLVLGQADFTHNSANRGGSVAANTLNNPQGLAFDRFGHLWVADGTNNRVVRYITPSSSGADADLVLGQADFIQNSANRGATAASNTLSYPIGLVFDIYGSLWVADGNNNRVLKYQNIAASGQDANGVLGQADFTHGEADRGGTVGADTMESPAGIAVDASGNLWITDFYNSRALFFAQPDQTPPQPPAGLTVE